MRNKPIIQSLTISTLIAAVLALSAAPRRAAANTAQDAANQGAAGGTASGVNETRQLNEQTAAQQNESGGDSGSCA